MSQLINKLVRDLNFLVGTDLPTREKWVGVMISNSNLERLASRILGEEVKIPRRDEAMRLGVVDRLNLEIGTEISKTTIRATMIKNRDFVKIAERICLGR